MDDVCLGRLCCGCPVLAFFARAGSDAVGTTVCLPHKTVAYPCCVIVILSVVSASRSGALTESKVCWLSLKWRSDVHR